MEYKETAKKAEPVDPKKAAAKKKWYVALNLIIKNLNGRRIICRRT